MSATGRYQSRLFNFLNRQSRRFVDNSDRTFRRLKVAANWAVQVAVYPFYLFLQTTRLAGQKFQQSASDHFPQLNTHARETAPLTVDTPIQEVLETVKTLILPETPTHTPVFKQRFPSLPRYWDFWVGSWKAKPPEPLQPVETAAVQPTNQPAIRSVATLMESKKLVLVSDRNEILDILSPDQERILSQKLIWAVANYWRSRRQLEAKQQPQPQTPLQNLASRETLLPPVRWFLQVMAWVQTGTVAIAINLFGESRLVHIPQPQPSETPSLPSSEENPPPFLRSLDRTIADLETHRFAGFLEFTQELIQRSQTLIQQTLHPLKNGSGILIRPATSSPPLEAHSNPLQALIRAAFDHFFNRSPQTFKEPEPWNPDLFEPDTLPSLFTSSEISGTIPPLEDNELLEPPLSSPPAAKPTNLQSVWQEFLTPPQTRNHTPSALPSRSLPEFPQSILSAFRRVFKPETPPPSTNPVEDGEDYWLTMEELFGTASPEPIPTERPKPPVAPPPALPTSPNPDQIAQPSLKKRLNQSLKTLRQRLPLAKPTSATVSAPSAEIPPVPPAPIAPSPKPPVSKRQSAVHRDQEIQSRRDPRDASVTSPPPHQIQTSPDWIETPATPIGYTQSPLEKWIEWLDEKILGLEEWLVALWQKIKQFFS